MTQSVNGTSSTLGLRYDSRLARRWLTGIALTLVAALVFAAEPLHAEPSSSRTRFSVAARMDSGVAHSCAVIANGALRCWGQGVYGQLGYGNFQNVGDNESPSLVGPVDLGPGRTAVAAATGSYHSCAILDNGTVRCWGQSLYGQLGYGNVESIGDNESPATAGPVNLGTDRTAVQISTGGLHTCAILDNGAMRCWGFGGWGNLGYGNTTTIGDNEVPATVGPVDLGTGRTATAVAAGLNHTCAILDNGTVKCWGYNSNGQLGYGNTTNIGDDESPASVGPVDLGTGRTATAIAVGDTHTCAILDNGTVKCWGSGLFGQLGYGNVNNVLSPAAVDAVDLGVGRTATAITASENHTCAILDNGNVKCWGSGLFGQLGYGNTNAIGDNEVPSAAGTVDLGTGRRAVAISTGEYFTCAQLDDGSKRCWGEASSGQLGNSSTNRIGDNEVVSSGAPMNLGATPSVMEVATGSSHTCVLHGTGAMRCWGLNSSGQLGYGNTEDIGDDEVPGAPGVVSLGAHHPVEIVAGEAHTCALLEDGTVRCWGKGASGQLGYGNTNDIGDNESSESAPTVNLGGESAIAIAAGANHTCALMTNGTMRCWGLNADGQLGYGNTQNVGDNEVPSTVGKVSVGRSVTAIAAGGNHTCARLDDGTMRCWGLGTNGRLGYANTTTIGDNELPSSVGTVNLGRNATGVAAGASHSCARLDDGTMRCWGLGTNGRLGYGNTNTIGDNELPSSVGTVNLGRNPTAISAGGSHSCARLDNGTVRCWGLASSGQLGYGNTNDIGDNEAPSTAGPVDLGSGRSALEVSAGASHTCVLLDNATVRCWGLNADGQLGYGNTQNIGDNESPAAAGPVDFVDDLPTAVNDLVTIDEDVSTAVDVLANDTDPDGGPRVIVSKTNGTHGTVTITGGGSGLTYLSASNYCGPDSFTYELSPGATKATVSVTVSCVDDAPVAVTDSATIMEDASATAIDVLANDTDIDIGPKKVASKTNGAHGSVAITGGGTGLTYTPAANYCGPDSFTYTLNGGSTATVSVDVTCVNDAPVAVNDSATVAEDAAASSIDVLANDTDDGEGPKKVESKTDGIHGAVAIAGGGTSLTYTPASNYCGSDLFTYTLNGGSQAAVSVTVSCVDDPPLAVNDSATVIEDASGAPIDVLANDTDIDAGPKGIASKTNGAHGTVAITGGGTGLTYAPDPDYCGSDSFTYELAPGSSQATVSLTVTCDNDPPAAVNDSATLIEDDPATAIGVLANDTDIDGGPKGVDSKTNGAHGTVTITGGGTGLSYAPDPNYCGADSFTYSLNGGSTASVSVTVSCVDDSPTAVNDSATVAEDAAASSIDVLANDTDVDIGPKKVESKTNGAHGTVAITGGGTGLNYTPDANYCGPDSFTYTLNGGSTATVSVTVSCVDDNPNAVADSDTVAEDSSAQAIDVLANDTDIDSGPKTINGKTNGAHGTVAITGGGTGLTYTPAANYCGSDSFTYTLNGSSQATVSITVTCVDDAPSAIDDSATVSEDSSAQAIDVLANDTDVDAGPKAVASKSNGAHGIVSITGGGSGVAYVPDANYCGADSFTYTLNGGSQATVSITVSCVDDNPNAVDDAATLAEDAGPSAVNVLANDTDPDAGAKTISSKANGAHGTVAITGGGTGLTYAPDPNYCGADSFTYSLNGGSTATVSMTVSCVDDNPNAVGDSDTVAEDSSAQAIDVLANDTDIDGGSKTITGKTNGAHGAVSLIGAGAGLTYTPEHDYCGPDSFTYTLGGGSTATVSITVSCVDEPAPPGGGSSNAPQGQAGSVQNVFPPTTPSAPVVNVTPGVGVVSGRRHPRIAIKGSYGFFTLTCRLTERDCSGTVTITATVPSIALGPTMEKVVLVKGKFRIGPGRSVLVRAKLTNRGLEVLEDKQTLRGVASRMGIVDAVNSERGQIVVNLVRRPKASLLPGEERAGDKKRSGRASGPR